MAVIDRLSWARTAGARLTTPLQPDDYLALVNPLWTARELRGRIEEVVPETEDAATVEIVPSHTPRGPRHAPPPHVAGVRRRHPRCLRPRRNLRLPHLPPRPLQLLPPPARSRRASPKAARA